MLSGRSLARQIAVSTLYCLDFNNELERAEEIDHLPWNDGGGDERP